MLSTDFTEHRIVIGIATSREHYDFLISIARLETDAFYNRTYGQDDRPKYWMQYQTVFSKILEILENTVPNIHDSLKDICVTNIDNNRDLFIDALNKLSQLNYVKVVQSTELNRVIIDRTVSPWTITA